jgi:hypothetical protein
VHDRFGQVSFGQPEVTGRGRSFNPRSSGRSGPACPR